MLFNNTLELAKYVPSIVRIDDFSLFESDLMNVELSLELDFLGGIYSQIISDEKLRKLCEPFVANRAAISFIPQLDLLLTESGFVVTSNSNQAPASKDRVERLIETCRQKSATSVENLLTYLASRDDYYDRWRHVKFCCRFDEFPCNTNLMFIKYAIGWEDRTSLDYRNLYSRMLDVQENVLIPVLGKNFYAYLLSNSSDDKVKPFITQFRKAFADAVIGRLSEAHNSLCTMLSYVIDHRTDFPTFDEWYQDPDEWKNSSDNNIVAFGI